MTADSCIVSAHLISHLHIKGSAVLHVCSSDWCIVGRVGEEVLPVGHCLLHLRPDSSDEAQPLVGPTLLTYFQLPA